MSLFSSLKQKKLSTDSVLSLSCWKKPPPLNTLESEALSKTAARFFVVFFFFCCWFLGVLVFFRRTMNFKINRKGRIFTRFLHSIHNLGSFFWPKDSHILLLPACQARQNSKVRTLSWSASRILFPVNETI